MKKIIKILFAITLSLTLCVPATVKAASGSIVYEKNSYGYMISTETYDNGDGTYTTETIYTKHSPSFYSSEMYGTDEFTKVKKDELSTGTLLVEYKITATFDWDTRTKKVKVYNEDGELVYNQGGSITNEKTTTSGNNSSKATAKYSFTRTTNLGFSTNYSVSVSCNYKGKDS